MRNAINFNALLLPLGCIFAAWVFFMMPIPLFSTIFGSVLLICGLIFLVKVKSEDAPLWLTVLIFLGAFFITPTIYLSGIGVYFKNADKKPEQISNQSYNVQASAPAQLVSPQPSPPPVQKRKIVFAADQAEFVRIIDKSISEYNSAINEVAKAKVKRTRNAELCQFMKDRIATNWRGRISRIGANSEGHGYLYVKVNDYIQIGTWNNALSDAGDRTLIKVDDYLYDKILTLKTGDIIEFSGQFIRGREGECLKESSMTLDGGMTSPDFVFRFKEIDVLN